MITTRIIRALALLAGIACAVKAQSGNSADTTRTTHFRLGGGTLWGDGAVGLVGIDWQPARSRFGLRATADYSRRSLSFINYSSAGTRISAADCTSFCTDRLSGTLGGFSVDAKYDLLTGRFRPYVFSGVGLYRSIETRRINADCSTEQFSCSLTPGELHSSSQRSFTRSMHSGLGASLRLKGRFELYGEAAWRTVDGNLFPFRGWNGPTTFGFRF